VEVSGGVLLAAESLRGDVQLIIGRPEIDAWGVLSTKALNPERPS